MKDKVLVGLVIILVLVIGFEGYYLFTHNNKEVEQEKSYTNIPNDNGDEEVDDYVILVDTREENSQVIQEYEMVLNEKKQRFEIKFIISENPWDGWNLEGIYNDRYFYSNEIYLSNGRDYFLNKEYIDDHFNENNFIIIKGTDNKNYLGTFYRNKNTMQPDRADLHIYNDNLEYLDDIIIFNRHQIITFKDIDRFYDDKFNLCSEGECQIRLKIDDNKIYALYDTCSSEHEYIIEERVYTINNNKLKYEVINTYDEEDFAGEGQSCY